MLKISQVSQAFGGYVIFLTQKPNIRKNLNILREFLKEKSGVLRELFFPGRRFSLERENIFENPIPQKKKTQDLKNA